MTVLFTLECTCGHVQRVHERECAEAERRAVEAGAHGTLIQCLECDRFIAIVTREGAVWNTLAASVVE